MDDLAKKIEKLINDNVPKSIDLVIPVSQDKALQEYLHKANEQMNTIIKIIQELDKRVCTIFNMTTQLMIEAEQSRVESWYRSIKYNKKE